MSDTAFAAKTVLRPALSNKALTAFAAAMAGDWAPSLPSELQSGA